MFNLLSLLGIDSFDVKLNLDSLSEEIAEEHPELAALTEEVVGNYNRSVKELKAIFEDFEFQDIFAGIAVLKPLAIDVIVLAEAYAEVVDDELDGKDKFKTAVKWLDEAIEVPGILEYVDGKVIEIVVNQGVKFLDGKFGKNFLEEFRKDAGKYREALESIET